MLLQLMRWWEWMLVICAAVGAVYCFWPLLCEVWDTLKHRRYMRKLRREHERDRPRQMSDAWKRMHRYDKEGDAA